MTTALWVAAVVLGFGVTVKASSEAVTNATELARGSRLPPFFIGMTLLALGTDLPEMANSIAASVTDNGDVNVGDSIGSTTTQLTLVFGLLPFVTNRIPLGERGSPQARGQQTTAWITALALLALALLLADDHIGRLDGALLIMAWLAGSRLVYRDTRTEPQLELEERVSGRLRFVGRLIVALVVIGAAATLAVEGLTRLAELWGVPAFVIAFFGASIGTSLPELVVAITALRRGEASLAIGDVLGSSFADATLSISVGPILFPTVIDGGLAVRGALVAGGAAMVVALLLGRGGEHDRRSGAILLLIYAASWPILL
ncbi:MAG: sodium:calcium antiporter [Actinomycetia bacterium]|nr:sodium:calcium antiporter [Actinomycetes bacterium]